jgi:hypothetical protein
MQINGDLNYSSLGKKCRKNIEDEIKTSKHSKIETKIDIRRNSPLRNYSRDMFVK